MTLEQRLRAALARYGRHLDGCPCNFNMFSEKCSCGLHRALNDFDPQDV